MIDYGAIIMSTRTETSLLLLYILFIDYLSFTL
jgi:hypothetical protein